MNRVSSVVLTASLLLAGSAPRPAEAVRRPEGVIRDFDIRSAPTAGAPGQRALAAARRRPAAVAARRADCAAAAATLGEELGPGLVVRWNEASGMPRAIFRDHGPLAVGGGGDAETSAHAFVSARGAVFGLDRDAVDSLRVARKLVTSDRGLTVIELAQSVAGVPVYGGQLRVAVGAASEIVSVSAGEPLASLHGLDLVPRIDPGEAVVRAAGEAGVRLEEPPARVNPASERVARFAKGSLRSGPTAELVLFPMRGSARLAFRVEVERADTPDVYEVVVDARDGSLLQRQDLTKYATYGLVFTGESPDAQGDVPARVQFYDDRHKFDPRWPLGWAFAGETIGNVCDAKEDRAGDDEATLGPRAQARRVGNEYVFDAPWTNSLEKNDDALPDVPFVTTQLFYLGNLYHDWLYPYGFDEAAGNWQTFNFGRGGLEGDAVFLDADDSLDFCYCGNANMITPPDGSHPRAQFEVWDAGPTERDSGVDRDIVFHELTHGLSYRLVGGADSAACLSGFQPGALGEGWSDWYAVWYDGDPLFAEYSTADPVHGLRSHPYDAYPLCHQYDGTSFCPGPACAGFCTAATCGECEVHDEGQLWAATLYEMGRRLRAAVPPRSARSEAGLDPVVRLVTDGLKLTPCNPTFLDARDAILLADRYDFAGAHECLLWDVFAHRSMGFSATTTGVFDLTPAGATDLPPYCLGRGAISLDRDRYACADRLRVTVYDGNAVAPILATLRAMPGGDIETVLLRGQAPAFVSDPVPIEGGRVRPGDGKLQVEPGETITAEYADAAPAGTASATALVSCEARVGAKLFATGGSCPDGVASWPVPLPQILDPGEEVDFTVTIRNHEPRTLTGIKLRLVSISDPRVTLRGGRSVRLPDLAPLTGSASASYRLEGARSLTPGTVTLGFGFGADGFSASETPIAFTVPVASDYKVVSWTSPVEDFEGGEGGFRHYPWPPSPSDEWRYGICGAASGTHAWHAGPATCSGFAAEQDANLETPVLDPTTPTLVSWYPSELAFAHRLDLGANDLAGVAVAEADAVTGSGDIGIYPAIFSGADNTGLVFQPVTLALSPDFSIGAAGLDASRGLVFYWEFYTNASPDLSSEWAIDDVRISYQAVEVVPQARGPVCRP